MSPLVSIIMGSTSDLPVMEKACKFLNDMQIPFEVNALSAHRTPDAVESFAKGAKDRGVKVIIAAAGMAAALPGVIAASTTLPVIGVPIKGMLDGLDAMLSIIQMPPGIPVATVGVNGAMNAVYVVGDAVGETMFYGAGAGSFPTASAVVGDILSLSEQISRGVAPLPEIEPYGHNLAFKPMDELQTKYYVRLKVADRVGALSETVDIFAKHNISISLINQVEDGKSGVSDTCSVIFLTHRALEKDVQAAAAELAGVDCVAEVANVLRIEDVEAWTEGVMAN